MKDVSIISSLTIYNLLSFDQTSDIVDEHLSFSLDLSSPTPSSAVYIAVKVCPFLAGNLNTKEMVSSLEFVKELE